MMRTLVWKAQKGSGRMSGLAMWVHSLGRTQQAMCA